ncbi:unnamed protein product [Rangifer tarandus platyrhynchus]|uniref:Uncharacterized protein n=1 Tax=Rangifer tarandus platyrhynchus TaxID=3082113 RepID=A0ABN8XKX0_RANTA|nr:unnamed protein product [Rangifer tarandus platyrhynchus]
MAPPDLPVQGTPLERRASTLTTEPFPWSWPCQVHLLPVCSVAGGFCVGDSQPPLPCCPRRIQLFLFVFKSQWGVGGGGKSQWFLFRNIVDFFLSWCQIVDFDSRQTLYLVSASAA